MYITAFLKDNGTYKKHTFENFTIHLSNGINISDDGYVKSDRCVIRIFESEASCISPEDKIEIKEGLSLPSDEALTVVRVTNNKKGTHPHIRVECA
jgi:hypothetical protein